MSKRTFENIKKQLKVIHDCIGMDVASGTNNTSSVIVKKEPAFEVVSMKVLIHDPTGLEEVGTDLEESSGEIIEVLVQLVERNQ